MFGSLGPQDLPFDEHTAYDPRSLYSASKAASDHLARARQRTYGLPAFVSSTTNNNGPWQSPEKLIPLVKLRRCRAYPCRYMATKCRCATGSMSTTMPRRCA